MHLLCVCVCACVFFHVFSYSAETKSCLVMPGATDVFAYGIVPYHIYIYRYRERERERDE